MKNVLNVTFHISAETLLASDYQNIKGGKAPRTHRVGLPNGVPSPTFRLESRYHIQADQGTEWFPNGSEYRLGPN